MTHQSRKEFLKKLAQGSVYAAPVVSTLLAPRSVNAQGQESQAMDMMGGPPPWPSSGTCRMHPGSSLVPVVEGRGLGVLKRAEIPA